MFKYYNPNPVGRSSVGDCSVRAISKALNVDWETAYAMIIKAGFLMGDMPSSNSVWGSVLRQHGFHKEIIPSTCPDCYTVKEFARDYPRGTYVLGTHNHVVCLIDSNWYDSWDSADEVVTYFWMK